MSRSLVLLSILCSACSSSSAPTPTPTAAPVPAPPPASYTITGTVTATNGAQPLSGLSVDLNGQSTTTNGAGAFTYALTSGTTSRLALTGAGIVPRALLLNAGAARSVDVGAIALGGGFDLDFYRQFVRNTHDAPTTIEPLRRWTVNPSFYMKVTDEAGVAMDAKTLDSAESTIRRMVPEWTNGRFAVSAFERGTAARAPQAGWISVNYSNAVIPLGNVTRCGDSAVAGNPGAINLYYRASTPASNCRCPGVSEINPRVVSHELGHALGFWHTDSTADVMFINPGGPNCDVAPSARERYHAAIAYARAVGNVDPDDDTRTASVLSLPRASVY